MAHTEHLWQQQQRLLISIKQEHGLMIGFGAASCVKQHLGTLRPATAVSAPFSEGKMKPSAQ